MMRPRPLLFIGGFLLAGLGGYWLARSAVPEVKKPTGGGNTTKRVLPHELPQQEIKFRKEVRSQAFKADQEALEAGALVGQRTLKFNDRAALEAFLARAGDRVRVMGRLDRLNVLRIGFLSYDDLTGLLDGTEKIGMIFPAVFPENESVSAQPGAMALGSQLLEWLGITGDNSQSGKGVKIAILDTGVDAHSSFGGKVIAMLGGGDVNGHGTAVASMIAGNTHLTPGVAPSTMLLSYQIGDAQGYSDSFKIAEAILAAVDAGASVINISFGSVSQSSLLSDAVALAVEAGVVIVAASGNSGSDRVYYPAADQGVIGVGAVDGKGELLAFSNTGNGIDVVAPGYGLNAAYLNDGAVSVSGTSFSAPIIAGMISKVVGDSNGSLNAQQAWNLISANLNEAGKPGYDTEYGWGIPDMSRVANASTPGIYDAAVASYWVDPELPTQVQVTIQNRGTEPLINAMLNVTTGAGSSFYNATTLDRGAIQTFEVPISSWSGSPQQFQATITLSGGQNDAKPANNRRVEFYKVPPGN
jgi:hypothetical protein